MVRVQQRYGSPLLSRAEIRKRNTKLVTTTESHRTLPARINIHAIHSSLYAQFVRLMNTCESAKNAGKKIRRGVYVVRNDPRQRSDVERASLFINSPITMYTRCAYPAKRSVCARCPCTHEQANVHEEGRGWNEGMYR